MPIDWKGTGSSKIYDIIGWLIKAINGQGVFGRSNDHDVEITRNDGPVRRCALPDREIPVCDLEADGRTGTDVQVKLLEALQLLMWLLSGRRGAQEELWRLRAGDLADFLNGARDGTRSGPQVAVLELGVGEAVTA